MPDDVIDPANYGVSFSLKQCRNFGLDPQETLGWLLEQGWRRFRLMSYWNEIEKKPGEYNFTELDKQIALIREAGGKISLCLGVKQPRWPEYHWPGWAKQLDAAAKRAALLTFVETVVRRYQNEPAIISWQLENEALLQGFGNNIEIDRGRLRAEFALVKRLDPTRPVVMSTSNNWGIPVRRPIPDVVGFSYYTVVYDKVRGYTRTEHRPWMHRVRKYLIDQLLGRPVFVHELQLEPWGPKPIWQMSSSEQGKSMNRAQIAQNMREARRIRAYPIDLWGAEWWYWRHLQGDNSIWQAVSHALQ
jgi:hypothetical protein